MTLASITNSFAVAFGYSRFPTEENETSSPFFRITTKTILSGSAAYLLFGPQIAICTVLVNLILSALTADFKNGHWFSKKHALEVLKNRFSSFDLLTVSKHHLFFFLFEVFSKAPFAFSAPSLALLGSLNEGKKTFFVTFSSITCLSPFVEEIYFRGFLQEKIRDIQILLFKGQEDSRIQKTIRVALQALVFGALHYHPVQGLFNFVIIPLLAFLGYQLGMYKERNHSLCDAVAIHSLHNTSINLRILIASRYWRLLPY